MKKVSPQNALEMEIKRGIHSAVWTYAVNHSADMTAAEFITMITRLDNAYFYAQKFLREYMGKTTWLSVELPEYRNAMHDKIAGARQEYEHARQTVTQIYTEDRHRAIQEAENNLESANNDFTAAIASGDRDEILRTGTDVSNAEKALITCNSTPEIPTDSYIAEKLSEMGVALDYPQHYLDAVNLVCNTWTD
jgi:hypothetical protein